MRLPWSRNREAKPTPALPACNLEHESANIDEALKFISGLHKSSDATRDEFRRTALHEAGHVVISLSHGNTPDGACLLYTANPDKTISSAGGEAMMGKGHDCSVCSMAGFAAEAEAGYELRAERYIGSPDHRAALLSVRGERNAEKAIEIARTELRARWNLVQDIASELLSYGRIGSAHIADIVENGERVNGVQFVQSSARNKTR